MQVTLAHYRNRFCMFRTYHAIAAGIVRADGLDLSVVEVPDPPSRAQEEALIRAEAEMEMLVEVGELERTIPIAPQFVLET